MVLFMVCVYCFAPSKHVPTTPHAQASRLATHTVLLFGMECLVPGTYPCHATASPPMHWQTGRGRLYRAQVYELMCREGTTLQLKGLHAGPVTSKYILKLSVLVH